MYQYLQQLKLNEIFSPSNTIGYTIGIIGIIIGIIFYIKSKKEKLPFYYLENCHVLQEIEKIQKIQINYDRKRIENLTITKLVIWNNGKETIQKTDIAKNNPLRITANNNAKILYAKILYQDNVNNNFQLQQKNNEIYINFDYFDNEEGAIIEIHHTGIKKEDLIINGAFKGVKKLSNIRSSESKIKTLNNFLGISNKKYKRMAFLAFMTPPIFIAIKYSKLNEILNGKQMETIFIIVTTIAYWIFGVFLLFMKRKTPKWAERYTEI
ncbi:MAG: hypothetical protein US89_C0009G0066 [Candidatus Peregrinibacteria bacterium GW2011_GWF2_38_29]|nr:MAG: hypothetical protein US89_C0009G0066 [Candidatus Peregrinibacteria bacterium GW2011_GWF2_38_29]HBB02752.1 hypothetical protein [Candidatus Peregrinibacteria bacterium]